MITIDFRYVSLYAHDADGVWVLFPADSKHKLTINTSGPERPLAGKWMASVADGRTAPAQNRVLDLKAALFGDLSDVRVKNVDDLLKDGLIQAAWRLSGGQMEGQDPVFKNPGDEIYDVEWNFGPSVAPMKLTNRVVWTGKAGTWQREDQSGFSDIELRDGEGATIENDDVEVLPSLASGVVKLEDFGLLYTLLQFPDTSAGRTAARPLPTADLGVQPFGFGGGSRPICPGGRFGG